MDCIIKAITVPFIKRDTVTRKWLRPKATSQMIKRVNFFHDTVPFKMQFITKCTMTVKFSNLNNSAKKLVFANIYIYIYIYI